jgi:hypothetical protein
MRQNPFAIVAALVTALILPGTPATADPMDIEPTSSFAWLDGHATDVEFDPAGRMWIWNSAYDPGFPHGEQANIFTQDADGNWGHSFRFQLKRHSSFEVAFATDGTVFSTDFARCTLQIAKLKASGAVKSNKKIKFKRSFCPYTAQPIDGRKVVLVSSEEIREYKLPLTSRSKPKRTVRHGLSEFSDVLVGTDGTVYLAVGPNTNQSVHVFLPTQSGLAQSARNFEIRSDYSTKAIVGMTFTREGDLALKMGANVAIFPAATVGDDQIPDTYYRFGESTFYLRGDVGFDSSGLMVITEYDHEPPVRIFFESDCPRTAQAVC